MDFKLNAPFQPTGDQPEAIRQLVEGVQRGLKHQVLLGATGTGKSLGYTDRVFIAERRGDDWIPQVCRIGELINSLVGSDIPCHWDGDTLSLDVAGRYAALAIQPETCQVEWRPVSALTCHSALAEMYSFQTVCGRSATLTGDHNVWVLRGGKLVLLKTVDICEGDYVPLPERIPFGSMPLRELDVLPYLSGEELFIQPPYEIRNYISNVDRGGVVPSLTTQGMRTTDSKLRAIQIGPGGSGIRVDTFATLLEKSHSKIGLMAIHEAMVSGKRKHDRMPVQMPLTPDFLRLLGYYLAEGNSKKRSIILADRTNHGRGDIRTALNRSEIPFGVTPSSDFHISVTALTRLFTRLCGSIDRDKRLPSFWAQLSNDDLAILLRAFYDGGGTVSHAGNVTTLTTSEVLASDLAYALLRFGIWARISRQWKHSIHPDHSGEWTYQVAVSGKEDLQRFTENIGFSLNANAQRLAEKLGMASNSNVDLVPIDGSQLRTLRTACGLTAHQLSEMASLSRSTVLAVEAGIHLPKRNTLMRLLTALEKYQADEDDAWRKTWAALRDLCRVRWTRVRSVTPVSYDFPYVYDLTVPGSETFLAGTGGFFVHNTFSIASVIQQVQKPALVMAHNKTLAAQLYAEFHEFFPENAVEYFVSYYDYYQPEAYVPRQDLYIEKETDINEEIERLRLAATTALMSRRDVVIVASVSCIYGLGSPEEYGKGVVSLKAGNIYRRNALIRQLVDGQYQRNDLELRPGTFRVRGDTLEIIPAYDDKRGYRIAFFGDEVEHIMEFEPLTGEILAEPDQADIYPAKHYLAQDEKLKVAISDIEKELDERLAYFKANNKLLEAQRIEQRTRYDLEMLKEVGYCSGIENYSRPLDQRAPGSHPWTLIDFLPSDYLLVIDESHMTIPQVRGMYNGDRSRKETLVEYGFRLPSALDNRPLKFDEFEQCMGFTIYTSATPGPYEMQHADQVVEQIIRPTGLVDPEVEVRPVKGQIDDLVGEIRARVEKGERVLVTTLTKRMAEDLADYLMELGIKVHYLHSEVETLERIGILRDLRLGVFDVIVGINLLREGLDLPEVSLVAILDADKEGFLRSDTALIQTIGRAARHINGKVFMYADRITDSMKRAIDETNRRRSKQLKFNQEHGITPVSIHKAIRDLTDQMSARAVAETRGEAKTKRVDVTSRNELQKVISELERQMKEAARDLKFEEAAALRDEMYELKAILANDELLKPWEKIKLLAGDEE